MKNKSSRVADSEIAADGERRSRFGRKRSGKDAPKKSEKTIKTAKKEHKFLKKFRNVNWRIPVFVLFLAVGVCLLSFGLYRNFSSIWSNMMIRSEADIEKDIDDGYKKIDELETERQAELERSGESEHYRELDDEITRIDAKTHDYEAELYNVQNDVYQPLRKQSKDLSAPFIAGGIFIILAALIVFFRTRSRAKILSMEE